MGHKAMRGRKAGRGTAVTKKLKQARREAKTVDPKLKRKQRKQQLKAAETAAEGGPKPKETKQSKKEARAQELIAQQHRALYAPGERILLLGEGNFSFARALCQQLGGGQSIFATCYDNEETLNTKYTDAAKIRKEIEEQFGGTTLVGVDATKLHSVKEFRNAFSKIVWNFPHAGTGETDLDKSAEEHRKLLSKFFKSAYRCLDFENPRSAIHVSLKTGEPYKSWKVVQTARAAAPLDVLTVTPFALHAWEGYAHRRTIGFKDEISADDNLELQKGANVYVFGPVEQDDD
mmetsp:Transcript_88014/g.183950  ORF Transcript_88014/g.183950 Transcript_88014/m.183950 type:complete len:290 (+) Transcript_88014:269-1138(+)